MPTGPDSGETSLPGLQPIHLPALSLLGLFPVHAERERERELACLGASSSYKDTRRMDWGPTLMIYLAIITSLLAHLQL